MKSPDVLSRKGHIVCTAHLNFSLEQKILLIISFLLRVTLIFRILHAQAGTVMKYSSFLILLKKISKKFISLNIFKGSEV